jgi:ethanolamine ammonia-lyase small subunit
MTPWIRRAWRAAGDRPRYLQRTNIRPEGLVYGRAADTLICLVTEARRRRLSGVALNDAAGLLGT